MRDALHEAMEVDSNTQGPFGRTTQSKDLSRKMNWPAMNQLEVTQREIIERDSELAPTPRLQNTSTEGYIQHSALPQQSSY